jgi:hypothetical protein
VLPKIAAITATETILKRLATYLDAKPILLIEQYYEELQLVFLRSNGALAITETERKVFAVLAIVGLRRIPKNGYRIPAAPRTPRRSWGKCEE